MSSFGRKKTTTKKLYAIKKSKTGRKSIVQVVSKQGKGRVYASTGRKLSAGTKSFTTKAAARKHMQESSFGRRKRKAPVKRKRDKAKKGEGYIACVNPDADPDRPSSYFKVFKAYTYNINGEKVRIFHTGSNTDMDRQYWRISDDSEVKLRKTRSAAEKDKIKYGRIANTGDFDGLLPEPCNDSFISQIGATPWSELSGSGLEGGSARINGKRMKVTGLMGKMLAGNKKGILSLENGVNPSSTQARLGTKGGRNKLKEVFGLNPNILGYSPELAKTLKLAPEFRGKSFEKIRQYYQGNFARPYSAGSTQYQPGQTATGIKFQKPGEVTTSISDLDLFSDSDLKNKETSSFGSMNRFGSIPTYGRYAYPVDPVLKRMNAQSGFGQSYYGFQPMRRPSFGRINYGFSRYF